MTQIDQLVLYLDTLKIEDRAEVIKAHFALVWLEGLDFAGAALRAGCSLTEGANGNPYKGAPP